MVAIMTETPAMIGADQNKPRFSRMQRYELPNAPTTRATVRIQKSCHLMLERIVDAKVFVYHHEDPPTPPTTCATHLKLERGRSSRESKPAYDNLGDACLPDRTSLWSNTVSVLFF